MTATSPPLDRYWSDLVTVALLGTDRRDPPEAPAGLLADLIDDTLHEAPSQRMLAAVSAGAAARRAGVRRRPAVRPARPARTRSSTGVFRGGRVDLEVRRGRMAGARGRVGADRHRARVAAAARRRGGAPRPAPHRRHPARPGRGRGRTGGPVGDRARARVGAADIGPRRRRRRDDACPSLAVPPGARRPPRRRCPHVRVDARPAFDAGRFGASHRAVLVNLLARCRPEVLDEAAAALGAVDPMSPSAGLALALADLARTRSRMLVEITETGVVNGPT